MGWIDQSFIGSYQDAARRRRNLPTPEEVAANDNDSWYGFDREGYEDMLRGQQQQAIAGGIVTGLTGATTLLSNAYKDAQIRDTSMQEGIISDLYNAGNYNYNNYDQLANDYAQTNFNNNFNYQDIRGMTRGQQVGSVATSTLSGAATGLQIGGPWGALIGGGVGLLTGLGGVMTGNAAAHAKQDSLNLQADLAADAARQNFAAAHERIGDNIHRQNAVNAVAKGGRIQTIKDYADRVLGEKYKAPKYREHHGYGGSVQRIKGENGLTIRFKK
jgi:hypothetical protein